MVLVRVVFLALGFVALGLVALGLGVHGVPSAARRNARLQLFIEYFPPFLREYVFQ
jgi:hypothetical protein